MSSLFDQFLSTSEAIEVVGERNFLQAMLRFEAALAQAQAATGVIPQAAAQSIIGTCKVDLFDVAKIVRDSAYAGSVAIPLVKMLRDTVALFNPDAAAFVNYGSTSQDVIDSAMALVTREALALIRTDVHRIVAALLQLAEQHAGTPMLARTLMQPACVTSFGLTCANWAAPLVRSLQRLDGVAASALQLQLGGTVGTLEKMQGQGTEIARLMAQALGLSLPLMSWHTQRDSWVALGCELGLLTGSLGKIAKDIVLLSQFEVAEVAEPSEVGRGGPPGMPHKHNPVACMVALAAAQRVPQRVAALLAAMPQEHERAAGAWQAELAEWPQLLMSVQGSTRALALALAGLQVDPKRMRSNLQAVRASLLKEAAKEWFNPDLVQHAAQLARQQVATLQSALPPRAVAQSQAPAPSGSGSLSL
jgi:3-carboxy-cis,cis-muconate cycloisomerase